jgi:phosphohistidine phosphatase SixA
MRQLVIALVWVAVVNSSAFAQSVFLVRHAERADTAKGAAPMMGTDPDLSDAGRRRAQSLAAMLKDAGITAIFVTEYKRTQQTAAPLAKALGLTPVVITSKDTPGLVTRLQASKGNVLVVGHSNSVPNVITGLGIAKAPPIADDEYDNLFIVHPPGQLIRLRFQ